MLILFSVLLTPGHDQSELLSAQVLQETQAQIMTLDQAKALGFSGIQPPAPGLEMCLLAVAPADAGFIRHRLEMNEAVQSFSSHQVDT